MEFITSIVPIAVLLGPVIVAAISWMIWRTTRAEFDKLEKQLDRRSRELEQKFGDEAAAARRQYQDGIDRVNEDRADDIKHFEGLVNSLRMGNEQHFSELKQSLGHIEQKEDRNARSINRLRENFRVHQARIVGRLKAVEKQQKDWSHPRKGGRPGDGQKHP